FWREHHKCALFQSAVTIGKRQSGQAKKSPVTGGGQGKGGSKCLNNFRSFDIPIVATATG
ncbi:hypothetical protein, partial [Escherichia coli]|uniref:hypothetical protein n=1 Tax=Escherichia coli TaxID=562 RepID=UPI0019D66C00